MPPGSFAELTAPGAGAGAVEDARDLHVPVLILGGQEARRRLLPLPIRENLQQHVHQARLIAVVKLFRFDVERLFA